MKIVKVSNLIPLKRGPLPLDLSEILTAEDWFSDVELFYINNNLVALFVANLQGKNTGSDVIDTFILKLDKLKHRPGMNVTINNNGLPRYDQVTLKKLLDTPTSKMLGKV